MKRRHFLTTTLSLPVSSLLADTPAKPAAPQPAAVATPAPPKPPAWHDVAPYVEGRGWGEEKRSRFYDRLPVVAEGKVPAPVWDLSRDSAGMAVRFKSNASNIKVRYTLFRDRMALPHMPATGVSGVDLYAKDKKGKWRWVGVSRPEKKEVAGDLSGAIPAEPREWLLYFPLFNGIEKLEIGVNEGASFEGLAPRPKPLVFYGTSITHGASASRPGMVHTAILGRKLDRPVMNLGFSGNGKMDASVGELMARLDPALFIIDCNPNMTAPLIRERCIPLVKQLRAARPQTPVVLVEDRRNTNSWIRPERSQHHSDNHAALKEAFAALQKEGMTRLFYIPGDYLLGHDADGATDGSHPNDLGFMRQAEAFEPVLKDALKVAG